MSDKHNTLYSKLGTLDKETLTTLFTSLVYHNPFLAVNKISETLSDVTVLTLVRSMMECSERVTEYVNTCFEVLEVLENEDSETN